MDLLGLRKQIDEIDNELIPLLLKRMSVSEQVAQYKAERGMPVLNSEREQQILDDVASKCGKHGDTIKTVFSATMDASRALQHKIIGGGKELRADIENAIKIDKLDTCGKPIACQGVEGAYSGVTSKKIFPKAPIHFHKRFEDVFEAVNRGDSKFGIIPVENSTAGSVHESYDLIMKYRFYIVGAYDLKIEHCLLGVPGTKISDIQTVYSHPQSLMQSSRFLGGHSWQQISMPNNAFAARKVAEDRLKTQAAIASEYAGKVYGLEVLQKLRSWSDVPVIIISARTKEQEKVSALDLGADDYITKPFGTGELMARIRTSLRHSHAQTPGHVYKALDLEIDFEKRLIRLRGEEVHLTQIEYQLLTLLAENSGRVLTYSYIMNAIWGPYMDNNNQILRVNMANIRRKLEQNPAQPQYVFTEIGVGYRMRENENGGTV